MVQLIQQKMQEFKTKFETCQKHYSMEFEKMKAKYNKALEQHHNDYQTNQQKLKSLYQQMQMVKDGTLKFSEQNIQLRTKNKLLKQELVKIQSLLEKYQTQVQRKTENTSQQSEQKKLMVAKLKEQVEVKNQQAAKQKELGVSMKELSSKQAIEKGYLEQTNTYLKQEAEQLSKIMDLLEQQTKKEE